MIGSDVIAALFLRRIEESSQPSIIESVINESSQPMNSGSLYLLKFRRI